MKNASTTRFIEFLQASTSAAWRYWVTVCVIAGTYFGVAKFGLSLAFVNQQVTAVWPPTGIALVVILLLGYRMWPGIWVGAFLINAITGTPFTAIGLATGNTLEAVAGAFLLHRFGFIPKLERLQDVFGLVGFAALLSTTISATVGVISLCFGGMPWSHFGSVWFVWWLGDAMGDTIVAPFLFAWLLRPRIEWRGWKLAESAALFSGLCIVSSLALAGHGISATNYSIEYWVFPFIIWAALRFGQRETVTAIMVVSIVAVWGAIHNVGPFSVGDLNERLNMLVIFMGVVAVTAMALGAVTAERKRSDMIHKQLEDELRLVVEAAPNALIKADENGVITLVNSQMETLFGYTRSEMLGQRVEFLMPERFRSAHASHRASFISTASARAMGAGRELFGYRKDGSEFPIEIGLNPIRTSTGLAILAAIIDISERRENERHQTDLNRKLLETQKLESLGVLAGGIAHDFNNLLTAILGNASLARLDLTETSPLHPSLDQIEQSAHRASDLCKQMLAYSGKGRFVVQRIDLNELVNGTTRLLDITISKKCVLRFNLATRLPAIMADATQIRQIIMNLVINASEAIGSRSGVIAIATGVVRVDLNYLTTLLHPEAIVPGDYVFLEISDNGAGMDAATLAKIFDPFFTTKFTGRGLGLAAVLGIIRGHKGSLKVYSEVGRGSTFKILLPCIHGENDQSAPNVSSINAKWRGEGTVLIVDDEETVRAVSARILESLGFSVELAADGREAFEKYRLEPMRYTLVLLDLTMPHMDGEEAFRQMRHVNPGVKVVLMSGYNEQEAISRFTGKGLAGFVQKPFEVADVAAAVRAVFRKP